MGNPRVTKNPRRVANAPVLPTKLYIARVCWTFWTCMLFCLGGVSTLLFLNAWVSCALPALSGMYDVCREVDHFYYDWSVGWLLGHSCAPDADMTGAHLVVTPLLSIAALVVLAIALACVFAVLEWWAGEPMTLLWSEQSKK